jgi:hypothetical protein
VHHTAAVLRRLASHCEQDLGGYASSRPGRSEWAGRSADAEVRPVRLLWDTSRAELGQSFEYRCKGVAGAVHELKALVMTSTDGAPCVYVGCLSDGDSGCDKCKMCRLCAAKGPCTDNKPEWEMLEPFAAPADGETGIFISVRVVAPLWRDLGRRVSSG